MHNCLALHSDATQTSYFLSQMYSGWNTSLCFLFPFWMTPLFPPFTRCIWVRSPWDWRRYEVADQRSELRPLQDVRHQGPQPEHQLGGARRQRRTSLQRNVISLFIQTYHEAPIVAVRSEGGNLKCGVCKNTFRACCQDSFYNLLYCVHRYGTECQHCKVRALNSDFGLCTVFWMQLKYVIYLYAISRRSCIDMDRNLFESVPKLRVISLASSRCH